MAKAPSSQKSPRKPARSGKRDTKRAKSSVRPASELPAGKWVTAARGKPAKRELEKAYLEMAGKLEASQADLKKTSRLLRKEIKHSEKIESELQFSEARLKSLTTFGDHHIFVLDKEGRYLFSNQKAGLSVSGELLSYVGRHQREFHAPEVAETYDAQIKSVLQTGKAVDFEHLALEKDGLHQHLDTLYPIAEGGRFAALGGICRDITRQKVVQKELLKSEERFKRMFELGLTGMAIISVDKVWQDVNDRLCEILGYPREELTRKTWAQITHPDDLAAEAAQFERVLAGEIDSYHVEKRFTRKDGRNTNAETSVACMRRLDGAVDYFVAFVQDNTDRKLAQDALQEAKNNFEAILNATQHVTDQRHSEEVLRESEQKYRSLFENSLDGAFMTLPDGTIADANPAACTMLGMSREEICRVSRAGIVVADANLESALEARRKTGKTLSELTFIRADGTKLLCETSFAIVADASGGERAFVIVRDITQRRLTEFERETTVEFLKEVNQCTSTNALVEASVAFFQKKSGCEAVGVRLKKGDDYPYYEARGFPDRFVAAENSLCAQTEAGAILRDGSGNPVLECMCGNVINSRFDPSQPFFTASGSFWTNSTTKLLASTSESDRQARTRNRCHGEGFESVALIPLAYGEEQLGLLQLNDRRRGLFTPEVIALWERLAGYLSVALAKSRAEEELRISEENYRRIVESANEGVWAMDSADQTTYVNRRMADMLGYTPEEMIGRAVDTFMFAEDLDGYRAKMAVRQKGGAGNYEWRLRCKDGREIWAIVSATALQDAEGGFAGSFGMLTDITARKLAEDHLAKREALLNRTQHLGKIGGWEWDVEKKAISWTEETYRIHELAPGELMPGSVGLIDRSLACYDEQDRQRIMEAFRRCAEEGEGYDLEFPFTTANGRRRWIRTTAEAVYDHGRIGSVVGNIMDITESKRADHILRARLRLSEAASTLVLEELLQQSLDEAERITGSCIGFFHFVEEDQQTLLLQMWSKNTLENLCTVEGKDRHYSVEEAGAWGDCIRARRPVIHNDYAALPHRKGLPPGHAPVVRELVAPILRNGRIVAVVGVGNKPQDYDEKDVEAVSSLADLVWEIVLRKMAEDQVNLQGLVLDQTRDHVAITNLEGVIIYTNQAECNAAKRQQEELIGKHISILGEDSQRGASQQEILDATLSMGEWRGEVVNIAADGTESIVDLRTFLVRGKTGKALAMCGIGTDITAGKKMEAALRESEERFRLTFDESPVGAAIVSLDFRFIAVNETLCRITGYSAEELTGVSFGEITHPDDIAADIKKAQQLLHGEINQYDMEKRYIHRNGCEAWIHLWVKLLRDKAGRPLYFLPIMEDITERKKAEEELRQSQVKLRELHRQLQNAREDERSRISRDIHDELGQNITALKIDLAWLKWKINPGQLDLLQKLESMNGVTDATLKTIRRVSSEMRPGVLDALGLAAGVDWLVKDFEKRTEIQSVLYIAPEEIAVEPNLATDVFRVLQETLTNIARHAQASMVWVTLRQTPDAIELNVADNGIGISEEKISQAVSLGLLGIRERLLSWGGTLSVTGLPGEGTSIRVFIPTEGKGGLV